jgi:hypothetical protein
MTVAYPFVAANLDSKRSRRLNGDRLSVFVKGVSLKTYSESAPATSPDRKQKLIAVLFMVFLHPLAPRFQRISRAYDETFLTADSAI